MTTQKLDALRDYNGAVKSAAQILKQGGIVAVPKRFTDLRLRLTATVRLKPYLKPKADRRTTRL